MTTPMVNISKPYYAHYILNDIAPLINSIFLKLCRVKSALWHNHIHASTEILIPRPDLIVSNKREYFLVVNGIEITKNQKLLLSHHNPIKKLPKKTKWRVRYNYVRLISKFTDFQTTKITITFKILEFKVINIDMTILVYISGKDKNLAICTSLIDIKNGAFRFK